MPTKPCPEFLDLGIETLAFRTKDVIRMIRRRDDDAQTRSCRLEKTSPIQKDFQEYGMDNIVGEPPQDYRYKEEDYGYRWLDRRDQLYPQIYLKTV